MVLYENCIYSWCFERKEPETENIRDCILESLKAKGLDILCVIVLCVMFLTFQVFIITII